MQYQVQEVQPGYSMEEIYRDKMFKYGTTYGISAMIHILAGEISPLEIIERESTLVGSFALVGDQRPTTPTTPTILSTTTFPTSTMTTNTNSIFTANPNLPTNQNLTTNPNLPTSQTTSDNLFFQSCIVIQNDNENRRLNLSKLKQLSKCLEKFVENDKKRGYKGERKGSEVCLPLLWPEIADIQEGDEFCLL